MSSPNAPEGCNFRIDPPTPDPRRVISRVAQYPEHIPIRVGAETVMLSDASDAEYAKAIIRWLEPIAGEGS